MLKGVLRKTDKRFLFTLLLHSKNCAKNSKPFLFVSLWHREKYHFFIFKYFIITAQNSMNDIIQFG